MLPFKENFIKDKQEGVNLVLEDSNYVYFDNYFSLKTFPEYQRCDVMDIKESITVDRWQSDGWAWNDFSLKVCLCSAKERPVQWNIRFCPEKDDWIWRDEKNPHKMDSAR